MTTIATDLWTFETAPDAAIVRTAIFVANVIDEVSGSVPRSQVEVQTNRDVAYARVAAGGMLSVSGRVEHLFPDLAAIPYKLELTISARGYRMRTRLETIPIASAFPIDLGTIALRPLPVRVEGRVTKESDRMPIPNARITVFTPKIALLRDPAYYDHPSGTAVTTQTLTPGLARTLDGDAAAGTRTFLLSDAAGLAANDVLLFDGREYGVIESADAGAKTVTLRHPLQRSYAATVMVQPVAIASGIATTTSHDVNVGDGVLLLNATLTSNAVSIGVAPAIEYHHLGVISDSNGFYAANGVGRARELTFRAAAGGFATLDVPLTIDYASPVNPSSFRLRP